MITDISKIGNRIAIKFGDNDAILYNPNNILPYSFSNTDVLTIKIQMAENRRPVKYEIELAELTISTEAPADKDAAIEALSTLIPNSDVEASVPTLQDVVMSDDGNGNTTSRQIRYQSNSVTLSYLELDKGEQKFETGSNYSLDYVANKRYNLRNGSTIMASANLISVDATIMSFAEDSFVWADGFSVDDIEDINNIYSRLIADKDQLNVFITKGWVDENLSINDVSITGNESSRELKYKNDIVPITKVIEFMEYAKFDVVGLVARWVIGERYDLFDEDDVLLGSGAIYDHEEDNDINMHRIFINSLLNPGGGGASFSMSDVKGIKTRIIYDDNSLASVSKVQSMIDAYPAPDAPYKVLTALLSQSGDSSASGSDINEAPLIVGQTYSIWTKKIKGVLNANLTDPGSGYVVGSAGANGGSGTGLNINVTSVDGGGQVLTYEIIDCGKNYEIGDVIEFANTGGLSAFIEITELNPVDDFTNLGAPNNDEGTKFLATGTTPSSWLNKSTLNFNSATPIIKILQNTIDRVYLENSGVTGSWVLASDHSFDPEKTFCQFNPLGDDGSTPKIGLVSVSTDNKIMINQFNPDGSPADTLGDGEFMFGTLEIRVYP